MSRPVILTRLCRLGFTLLELLVVVAIISALTAVLFPVFAQVREKARQAMCAENLRQISGAIALYRDDYEYYVPQEAGDVPWMEVRPGMPGLLNPYLRNSRIGFCPSRRIPDARYCINGWHGAPFGFPETTPAGQLDAAVLLPSSTLIVWEHQISAYNCLTGQFGGDRRRPDPRAGRSHWDSSHHDGFMTLWCDGHVRRMRYSDLLRRHFTIEDEPEYGEFAADPSEHEPD